jgi:uncharacterized damage-inducible protein DinB
VTDVYDEHGRPEPPSDGDELATLNGFLDYQRATLAWKCSGLGSTALNTKIAVSSLTLGGLLKHMAAVEEGWFSRCLNDDPEVPPWDSVDWESDPDWDFHSAALDSPDQLLSLWGGAVDRSRRAVEDALQRGGLDQAGLRLRNDGRSPSLRWILCHMIEEYARHNGHADLLREAIDGETGE